MQSAGTEPVFATMWISPALAGEISVHPASTVVRSVRLSGPRKGEARWMYVDPEALLALDLKGHPAFVTPVAPVAQQ